MELAVMGVRWKSKNIYQTPLLRKSLARNQKPPTGLSAAQQHRAMGSGAPKTEESANPTQPIAKISSNDKQIERIVIFYKDGRFENFVMNPSN